MYLGSIRTARKRKWKGVKIYNLAESSFISSCRESHSGILSVAIFRGPLGDEVSAPVSPCCHSRVQIFRLVRRISIYPIYDTCGRRRDDGRRFAQLNTIRSVFCFSSLFPLNLFYGLQHASINVYNAARSPSLFMPLESLHDWKKPTEYKLIKAGRYRVLDRQWRRLFFDLLHWFRRTRVDLSGS